MKASTYEQVNNQILEALENGTVPWKMPWQQAARPLNIRGSLYRGINYFLLNLYRQMKGYTSPYWLTFKQAKDHGGNVKAGEKASVVVFWKTLVFTDKDKESGEETTDIKRMVKHYFVFNIDQTENVRADLLPLEGNQIDFSPIERAEAIVAGYPKPPTILFEGDVAKYSCSTDTVTMPPQGQFHSNEDYYDTLFHELGHSTRHPTRLNRPDSKTTKDRAMEELIAELTAAFLCSEAGIGQRVIENESAYIANWLQYLKSEKTAFLLASARAQKSADFILGRKFESEAKPDEAEAPSGDAPNSDGEAA
jgi:antirestriction protein ArdC